MPERVSAQVMNIGDYDDVRALVNLVCDEYVREVLRNAEIGQFNAHLWHYRLRMAELGEVPPMSTRRLG